MIRPSDWSDAKRLFAEAQALPPAERDALLARACEGQPELHAEVQSLLEWDRHATGFLEPTVGVGPIDWLSGTSLVGSTLGPWRISGIIGSGGMGTVYRAERADDAFTRQVAIKVVRAGMPSAALVERFRRERETLAALDHPAIARVIDGGNTPQGQPYLVMELVDGTSVDRHCDQQRLTVDDRLALFCAICAGVQYAHENLVVHRDIKPDNILVGRDGRPKLLDFGISTLLTTIPATGDETTSTTWLLTPDYASPEQMAGRPISTASDVYSLGVLLYVLLTGTRPYHLQGKTLPVLHAELAAAVWTPPSARARMGPDAEARAEARHTTPPRLQRALRGDLDAIVGRALSRDVASRYSTAQQLVADVEAHRARLPVSARGRDAAYLARTFLRRHAVAAAVAAAVTLGAVAGVGAIVHQARVAAEARARAERRFEEVRRLARTFMFDVNDAIGQVPGATAARALIVRNAIEYLDRLAGEAGGDRGLDLELARAFIRVGDAQGHTAGPNLGDVSGAIASYRRAIAIAEAMKPDTVFDAEIARLRALAHRRLGDSVALTGDVAAGVAHAEQSASLYGAIAAEPAASVEDRLQAGIAAVKLGDLLGNPNFPNLGRASDAMARYQTALVLFQQLSQTADNDPRVRRYVGLTLERFGTLHEDAGRLADAAAAYRDSFDIRKLLVRVEPVPAEARRDLAVAYEKIANVDLRAGRLVAARANYRDALAQFEQLHRADPGDANAQRSLAISQEKLAATELALGQPRASSRLLSEALALHRSLAARDPANVQARCDAARAAEDLGAARAAAGTTGTCAAWQESLDLRTDLTATSAVATCATASDLERLVGLLRTCR